MSNYIERYWRDATPADAIKEPPMLARFRDTNQEPWESGCLSGFDRRRSNSTERWWYISDSAESFNFCQVYDAPDPGEGWRLVDPNTETLREGDGFMVSFDRESGWLEVQVRPSSWSEMDFYRRRIEPPKPDPGEGWRLIDTEKETPKNGDEFLLTPRNEWITIVEHPSRRGFAENYIYRRRIEQPKPQPRYEPFRWEDREQLRGRWIGSNDGRWERFVAVMYRESEFFWVNGINAESLCADWRFMDTGEPVGRRVE